ncbi:MAG TPA: hypothetical protein VEQ36_02675 [Thermomicrobiales bacterium]|nr:hypothetical protein [Thermomicrobiales bacterium]
MSEDPASVGASDRAAASEAIPAADSAKVPVESATEDQATSASRIPDWADEAVDVLLVLVLAAAAVAAAWSGYQAARWSGVQASNYAQASAKRIESTRASTAADQQAIIDVMTFTNYVNAWRSGDTELADFYRKRFRAEFVPAFDAWMATDPVNNSNAPSSPFAMPEYAPANLALADQLESESEKLFAAGTEANQRSDDYVLNTVFLASVLFFAGIAPRVRWLPAQLILVGLALALLGYGLINVIRYPIE